MTVLVFLGCPSEGPGGDGVVEPCTTCTTDLGEAASWDPPDQPHWAGYDLDVGIVDGEQVVLVGGPGSDRAYGTEMRPLTAALRVPDLAELGRYQAVEAIDVLDGFGIAVAHAPGGGMVVGAPWADRSPTSGGVLYGFDRLPDGVESYVEAASFTIHGECGSSVCDTGTDVLFADFTGSGEVELVVGASATYAEHTGGVYIFASSLTGDRALADADRTFAGPWLGNRMAAWDSDGDGLDELVTRGAGQVYHVPSPWLTDLEVSDADVVWTQTEHWDDLGDFISSLGDLDGDGLDELAIGAELDNNGDVDRAGALYVVHGGAIASGPIDDVPLQFLGSEPGEGMGSCALPGDYDGDGQIDLLVGAADVIPSPGAGDVLVYLGPLPQQGTLTAADATSQVEGEAAGSYFGAHVVPVDGDGDGRTDVVVSAQGLDGGRGRVYLLLATELLP